ncbi:MAG TPA: ATP-dependent zinc metalloprotease FtsH [Streptosporangiaceae bacterium]|jgi:cell division protease FtsH|nr:ATP-dependent zinc metalloprotease FtsH [Streptosporangiaceae bacterium]
MSKQPNPPPPGDKPVRTAPPPPPGWRHGLWPIALIAALALFWLVPGINIKTPVSLTYSQFTADASAHKIKTVVFGNGANGSNTTVTGTLTNGKSFTTVIPGSASPTFAQQLRADGVQSVTATAPSSGLGTTLLYWLFLLLPFIIVFWLFRRMSRAGGGGGLGLGALGIGRSNAKVFDAERPQTKFSDVAGYEGVKSEIGEVIDFLRNPGRYQRAGAMAPRGMLMIGPPGTGKTLLARAVAGESEVPFFSVTGSSFVETFVGVGAARVRDLFSEARKRAPAIIFIDEIDAIGQRRAGSGAIVANDEREQTLNQLLSEMDGFDVTQGIVVLGATNRPEVLDPALLRPGRFDRQVTIPLPTLPERAAILVVHCRDKKLGPDVDLNVVARGTPGFSGADLANLANEAAIVAVRDNREVLSAEDFSSARDRILLGRREGSNVLLPDEKHAVAIHESGHALVAALSKHADPVAKITILPAGQTLGVTEQLPIDERHLYSEDYLTDSLAVRLGGRAAELVEFGQGSTGASNDLASATDLAIKMVREFGLSPKLGPVGYPEGGSVFLGGGGGPGLSSRPFAEATQATIDSEVARLLREAEQTAVELLRSHRPELDQLVDLLVEQETVDGSVVYRIVGKPVPEHRPEEMAIAPHTKAAAGAVARDGSGAAVDQHRPAAGPAGSSPG